MDTAATAAKQPAFRTLPLNLLHPSETKIQAVRRAHFDQDKIVELAESIKQQGLLQPILVRFLGANTYEIVAGERRYLAAKKAGLTEVDCHCRELNDEQVLEAQLVENLQREDVHPLEEAEGYRELLAIKKIKADDLGGLIGKSRAYVYARMKLLDLCPEVRKVFDEGKIDASVALEIARIRDPKCQQQAVKGCLTGDDLGKFNNGSTDYDGPLTFIDAKQYIHEEFIVYQDGAAAVEEAKKKGLPAKNMAETRDLWKRNYAPPAGHILVEDVKDKIGDQPAGAALWQNPHTGAAQLVLKKEKAIALFKEKKLALPHDLKPRPNYMGSGSASPSTPKDGESKAAAEAKAKAAAERKERENELKVKIQVATYKAVRAKFPAKIGKAELLDLLQLLDDQVGNETGDTDFLQQPKSLDKCQERELVRFALDYLYANNINEPTEEGYYGYKMKPLLDAAKRYGVNAAAIAKDLTEEFNENEAAISGTAAPAKKATVTKSATKKKASKK